LKNTVRNSSGKYDFSNFELICKCGHKLGIHAADNPSKLRPCFNGDDIDGATGEFCKCENFKKMKKIIVEVYSSDIEDSIIAVIKSDKNKHLAKDAILLRTITGIDWDDCMKQHHELMDWEPYKPF